jgi:hypothetical protein
LLESLCEEFSPATDSEQFLIAKMAQSRRKMQRIDRLETLALDLVVLGEDISGDSPDHRILAALSQNNNDPLPLLNRYRTTAERSYYKALARLQQDRRDNRKSQDQAMDRYIKDVVFAPAPQDVEAFSRMAQQVTAAAIGTNGFASQKHEPPLVHDVKVAGKAT